MQLTKEQQTNILNYLKSKSIFGNFPCSVCKSLQWAISDTVFELREFNGGAFIMGGSLVPLITITCSVCGNTFLFNALMLGIVKPQQPPTQGGTK